MKPGDLVWYRPSLIGKDEYAAVVASETRYLGETEVVTLRDLDLAYWEKHHPGSSRVTVPAACVEAIRPRTERWPHEPDPDARARAGYDAYKLGLSQWEHLEEWYRDHWRAAAKAIEEHLLASLGCRWCNGTGEHDHRLCPYCGGKRPR
jgi:hypothetical protein